MFAAALEALAKALTDAGVNASVDPADVNPPGIVVRPETIPPASSKLCGTYPLRVTLWLVVPATAPTAALRALDELYDRVVPIVNDPSVGTTLTNDDRVFQRLVMPDDPAGLPALRLTATTPVPATAPAPTR